MRLRRKAPLAPPHGCAWPWMPDHMQLLHCRCGKSWLYMGDGRWRNVTETSMGSWWASEIKRNPDAQLPQEKA